MTDRGHGDDPACARRNHEIKARAEIWNGRSECLVSAQRSAENLFRSCHQTPVELEVILFGFPGEAEESALILESSKSDLKGGDFDTLLNQIEFYRKADPDFEAAAEESEHREQIVNSIRRRSEAKAVTEALESIFPAGEVFFRGDVLVGGYWVGLALVIDLNSGRPPYTLPRVYGEKGQPTPGSVR